MKNMNIASSDNTDNAFLTENKDKGGGGRTHARARKEGYQRHRAYDMYKSTKTASKTHLTEGIMTICITAVHFLQTPAKMN